MKMGRSVDLNFPVLESVMPFTQTPRRTRQSSRIFANAHAAPIHRLDMHRPEPLDGLVAHIRAHTTTLSLRLLASFFALLTTFFTTQYSLIFLVFACSFLASEILQPMRRDVPRQTMLLTIDRLRKTTAAPRFDVNQSEGLKRLVLEMSRPHRRSSIPRRNPICCEVASSKVRAGSGRLPEEITAR